MIMAENCIYEFFSFFLSIYTFYEYLKSEEERSIDIILYIYILLIFLNHHSPYLYIENIIFFYTLIHNRSILNSVFIYRYLLNLLIRNIYTKISYIYK